MHLYPIDGAAHRVGPGDTAFSFRDARWSEVIVGVDPSPARAQEISAWAKDYWNALHPYSAGGAYVNFMMDEGQERVRATYRDNYARLVEVTLTPVGRDRLAAAYVEQDRRSSALLAELSQRERADLDEALHHLLAVELDPAAAEDDREA